MLAQIDLHNCDQIFQKGSYTRTVSRHTFHRYINAPTAHVLILLKVEQSAFTQASFSSLSCIYEYLGGLSLGKQTADCVSPHDWLMSVAMDLTALCDMWR